MALLRLSQAASQQLARAQGTVALLGLLLLSLPSTSQSAQSYYYDYGDSSMPATPSNSSTPYYTGVTILAPVTIIRVRLTCDALSCA